MKLLKLREIPILKCLSLSQRIILKGSFFQTREEVIKGLYYIMVLYIALLEFVLKILQKYLRKYKMS